MCLKDVNLQFGPYIHMLYDKDTKRLSINETTFPDDFFPKEVASVATIVGSNGCGKSTSLCWLMERILSGYSVDSIGGIIAVKDNDVLKIYHDVEIANYKDLKAKGIKLLSLKGKEINMAIDIPLVFETNCFDILRDESPLNQEKAGEINISDKYLLLHDLKTYRNFDTDHSVRSFNEHVSAYSTQNNLRICLLLFNSKFRKIVEKRATCRESFDLRLPPYVCFSQNTSAERNTTIKLSQLIEERNNISEENQNDRYNEIDRECIYLQEIKNLYRNNHPSPPQGEKMDAIESYIRSSLRSFFYNLLNINVFEYDIMKKLLDDVSHDYYETTLSNQKWLAHILKKYIDKIEEPNFLEYCKKFFNGLVEVIGFLSENALWDDNTKILYLDADMVKTNPNIVNDLIHLMKNPAFLTERFFDLWYSHDRKRESKLSGGELSLLNLFSRILEAWTHQISPVSNNIDPSLLILDEVEVGYHPEWQRRFINELLTFMSSLASQNNPVQIIYTTHSPITLSDMPKQCVNLLWNDGAATKNIEEEKVNDTFGANVFDLYGDSFFMRNGLVGEFASEKIRRLAKNIEQFSEHSINENYDDYKSLKDKINIIGDERIRRYLLSRLDKNFKETEIERLQKRIKELEEQRENERN